RHREADADAAAGDDGELVVEVQVHACPWVVEGPLTRRYAATSPPEGEVRRWRRRCFTSPFGGEVGRRPGEGAFGYSIDICSFTSVGRASTARSKAWIASSNGKVAEISGLRSTRPEAMSAMARSYWWA